MPTRRKLGLVGAALGVLTAGAGAAVAVQQRRAGTQRRRPDARAGMPFGSLPADRTRRVGTDDGIELYVEEVGRAGAPLVVVFVHGYTLAMGSWHYQRLALADPDRLLVFYDQRSHGRSDRAPSEREQEQPQLSRLHFRSGTAEQLHDYRVRGDEVRPRGQQPTDTRGASPSP